MINIINKLRITVLIVMILTSIPLLIHYFLGTNAQTNMITHLHVYSGILFIIVVILNMIINKKAKNIKSVNY
jgi:hypothetical protein